MARYGIAKIVAEQSQGFPWATFLANVVSCIILGLLIGYQLKHNISENYKVLLMTGFCGGFSTFSTFSAETLNLIQADQFMLAFVYIAASLLVCLLCIFLGIKLM